MPEIRWVTDTSVITHLFMAGYGELLKQLAPDSVLVVPSAVVKEIEDGRDTYAGMPDMNALEWLERVQPTEVEGWTALKVKAAMGGDETKHLGECEVIAIAKHRGMVALIDERAAITQAHAHGVTTRDTLWLVIEAYGSIFENPRADAAAVVDALLEVTDRLPIDSGEELFVWAYEEGYLPR
ncbi:MULTISPECIES: hypothetical protein [unclassified Aeromicrobium]|uniref:hypothetical protein n=1 Tax=unclassified Aeromicrobium TaxID=2633570 RepID=UPI00396B33BA